MPRARGCTVHRASIARSCSTGGIRAQPPCQSELAQPFGSVRPRSADSTSGRRGREFKSPPPDQVRGGFRCWCRQPADSASAQRAASSRNDRPHCRQHRPAARHRHAETLHRAFGRRVWRNPGAVSPALRPPRTADPRADSSAIAHVAAIPRASRRRRSRRSSLRNAVDVGVPPFVASRRLGLGPLTELDAVTVRAQRRHVGADGVVHGLGSTNATPRVRSSSSSSRRSSDSTKTAPATMPGSALSTSGA